MKPLTKINLLLLCCLMSALHLQAQDQPDPEVARLLDSLDKSWQWKTGSVALGDNLANINVPTGWRYLPADQSKFVLEDLWGNPGVETMGMLFPSNVSPLDSNVLAFDISFDEMGFVKDDDADDINYNDLLKDLQKDAEEGSKQRVEMGYDAVKLIGWASSPYYDKEKKILHWAKEIQFGDGVGGNTLNYDVRVLGRKGVLSMNAIGNMTRLNDAKSGIPAIVSNVSFAEGQKYGDFDSKVDNVAAWTIGGLVAGKVLAKAGFFVIILKFIKPILLVLFAGGAGIWKWISGRRRKEEEDVYVADEPAPPPPVSDTPTNDVANDNIHSTDTNSDDTTEPEKKS